MLLFIQCTLFLWEIVGGIVCPILDSINRTLFHMDRLQVSTISGKIAVTNTIIGTNKIIIFQFPGLQLSPWRIQFKTLHKLRIKL